MTRRMMYGWMLFIFIVVGGLAGSVNANPTAKEALQKLQEGNERFFNGQATYPDLTAERRVDVAQHGQHPFVIVLGCADSRVPSELIFDQGIGDIFDVRVAGHVYGQSEVASIEYGVEHLGAPLVLVLGHSKCGAVTAAAEHQGPLEGNLGGLLRMIMPVVRKLNETDPDLKGEARIEKLVEMNVLHVMGALFMKSPIICEAAESGHIEVLGGIYDLESGKVEWLGKHPREEEILNQAKEEAQHEQEDADAGITMTDMDKEAAKTAENTR